MLQIQHLVVADEMSVEVTLSKLKAELENLFGYAAAGGLQDTVAPAVVAAPAPAPAARATVCFRFVDGAMVSLDVGLEETIGSLKARLEVGG